MAEAAFALMAEAIVQPSTKTIKNKIFKARLFNA